MVHDCDDRLDPLEVLHVLGYVLPGRLEMRDEGDALPELRMLLEEDVESRESAQYVLGQVRAVHAENEMLAPSAQDFTLALEHLVARRDVVQARGVDRQWI